MTVVSIAKKAVVGVAIVGIVVTVSQYLNWKQVELSRVGQGPAQTQAVSAQSLGKLQQVDWAGIRFSFPQEWTANVTSHSPGYIFSRREKVAEATADQTIVYIWVQKYDGNLINASEDEEKNLPTLDRERQYLNTDQNHAVVLTWVEGEQTFQRALFAEKGRLVIVQSQAPTSSWTSLQPTFWSVYESVILF